MMLAPNQRSLMLEALRPPKGYTFDRGIGTTFTLNLMTLLVAPLSLALHDVSNADEALSDPVLLLDGVRHYADHLILFNQAGYIALPKQANHLYRFLEDMVFGVRAPNGGLFHPKIWLLRYTAIGVNPVYRFLCLSRNVDFSRSWDLILRLDGECMDRKLGYSRNNPLGDFIAALPGFMVRKPGKRVREDIKILQEEVRKVDFRVPHPFHKESLEFVPLGDRKHRRFRLDSPKLRGMIVSPFLSEKILEEATSRGDRHVLLSEAEGLRRVKQESLDLFTDIYIFNDAGINFASDDEQAVDKKPVVFDEIPGDPARLHAKLFVFEEGWDAQWWIGSANATWPALDGSNVEFMVGLRGRKSRVGIDKILGHEDDNSALCALLAEYEPGEFEKSDADLVAVERLLEDIRKYLVSRPFKLTAKRDEGDDYDLYLTSRERDTRAPDGLYSIKAWPLTLRETRSQEIVLGDDSREWIFFGLSVLQLTSFVAFEVNARVGKKKRVIRFVLNLPTHGFPKGRDDHLISAILSDKRQFLRYLRFLLAEELGWLPVDGVGGIGKWFGEGRRIEAMDDQIPLLEDLARAFSRSPEKIDQVTELVEHLCATPEGRRVLPEGFEDLIATIRKARVKMR